MDNETFNTILQSAEDIRAYRRGDKSKVRVHRFEAPDIKAIRASLGMTQEEFAARFVLPLPSVKNWESGRRQPDSSTRAYLRVIQHNPDAVLSALNQH